MTWTAIVPIKLPQDRKTRLGALERDARLALTERMLAHVLAVLHAHPAVARIIVLSSEPIPGAEWIADAGRGLNAELTAARAQVTGAVAIVHADLPLVAQDDLSALFATAEEHGAAVAPDRHGSGTNAVALLGETPFAFRFGPGSRALHAAQVPHGALVDRPGLATDIDTPDDLALIGWPG